MHLMATKEPLLMFWAFSTSEKVPSPFFAMRRYFFMMMCVAQRPRSKPPVRLCTAASHAWHKREGRCGDLWGMLQFVHGCVAPVADCKGSPHPAAGGVEAVQSAGRSGRLGANGGGETPGAATCPARGAAHTAPRPRSQNKLHWFFATQTWAQPCPGRDCGEHPHRRSCEMPHRMSRARLRAQGGVKAPQGSHPTGSVAS